MQYWPVDNDEVQFGRFTVRVQSEDIFPDYIIRRIEVNEGSDAYMFTQFHFLSWPDKSVPTTAWSLVNFWRAVNKHNNLKHSIAPVVIHCSAGVGRTGTYIALDNLYNQAKKEGCIRPVQMVETLRRQRVNMVQTKEQYVYMHEAVAEALLLGTHFVLVAQFEEMFGFMLETGECGHRTNLELQYETLGKGLEENAFKGKEIKQIGNPLAENTLDVHAVCHKKRSTSTKTLQKVENADAMYTNISETVQLDFKISKSALQTTPILDFKGEESGIIVEEPSDDNQIEDLLTLVRDKHASTVIHAKVHEDSVFCRSLQSCNEESKGNFRIRDIVSHNQGREWFSVGSLKLFEYSHSTACDYGVSHQLTVLNFLTEVFLWQGELSNKKPFVIIDDESKQAGIICVLINELSRIRMLGQINILETVKRLRETDRTLINSFEQYKFCYDVILLRVTAESDMYQTV